ncbi:DUF3054 domain-containing protein [Paenibacillus sp. J2TS4]|uniref:DUF3054 domain-containing protein n=1 Tax=Paenibacillus sp. J2TS4 TaxID=2807194 RepID=UPI001B2AF507|nr:DUF3054 domain-containing protein [Paenibacillus sp. J2TS4]GIP33797.1 hypothetical protein J2TS4_30070 [Paenibacillus sp. J2TS4]
MNNMIKRSRTAAFSLLAGDWVVLLLFTVLGGIEHQMGLSVWDAVIVALPYLIIWPIIAFLSGAYRDQTYSSYTKTTAMIAIAWVITHPLALGLRWFLYNKPAFTTFAPVALVFVYLFLVIWRLIFVWIYKRSTNETDKQA